MDRRRSSALALALVIGVGLAAAAAVQAAPKPTPTPPPAKPAVTPLSDAQKQAAKKYAAAMKRGRAATKKKDYAAAVAAFGDALAARPDDAQALAERGFARLLAKDYDAAEADLRAAQKHAAGASLEGMIWFNLGLVAEARNDAEAARKAFAESNRLHPTKAAALALKGNTCSAEIVRAHDAGTTYASWIAAAKGLA